MVGPGGLLFAGGSLRLVPGYAGPAIRAATPLTGAAQDINLLADDTLDETALWALMGEAGHLELAVIYDQTGHGHHITQNNPAHRYVLVPGMRLGRAVAFINDSEIIGTTRSKWMTIPDSLGVPPGQPVSAAVVANSRNYHNFLPFLALTGSDAHAYGVTVSRGEAIGNGGSGACLASCGLPGLGGFVAGFGAAGIGGGLSNIHANGHYISAGHGKAGYRGGFLGLVYPEQTLQSGHEIAGILISPGLLSGPGTITEMADHLARHFALPARAEAHLILDGDSITYGYSAAWNQDYPHLLRPLLARSYEMVNTGVSGARTSDRLAALPGILQHLSEAKRGVLVEWLGTNDINSRVSLEAMQDNLRRIIALAKAAGLGTVAVTCLPSCGFLGEPEREVQRVQWNAWLRAGASGADALADVAAEPIIGDYANALPGAYYDDGTHPTTLAYTHIAPIIAEAVNRLAGY